MRLTLNAPASEIRSPRTTDTGMGTSCATSSTRRAVTTTDSLSLDGCNVKSEVMDVELRSMVFDAVSNPSRAASMRYEPGGSLVRRYVPSASVVTSRPGADGPLDTLTVTPGSTPPVLSFTTPLMSAPAPWADADATASATRPKMNAV